MAYVEGEEDDDKGTVPDPTDLLFKRSTGFPAAMLAQEANLRRPMPPEWAQFVAQHPQLGQLHYPTVSVTSLHSEREALSLLGTVL